MSPSTSTSASTANTLLEPAQTNKAGSTSSKSKRSTNYPPTYTPPSPPSSSSTPSPPSTSHQSPICSPHLELLESTTDPWVDTAHQSSGSGQASGSGSGSGSWVLEYRPYTLPEGPIQGLDASWRLDMDDPIACTSTSVVGETSGTDGKKGVWESPIKLGNGRGVVIPLDPVQSSNGSLHRRQPSSSRMKGKEKEIVAVPVPVPVDGRRPLPTQVWGDVTASSNGRDKVLKCVQYTLKTYLYLLGLVAAVKPLSPWFVSNRKRMKLAMSGLSLSRKCLLLTNSLHPLSSLLSPEPMSALTMLRHVFDLLGALADDVYCLYKLGIVGNKLGKRSDTWSTRFWFADILMSLWKLHRRTIPSIRRKQLESNILKKTDDLPSGEESLHQTVIACKTETELNDAKWTNRKLLCDLVFCSYDVFGFERFSEPVQTITGLGAALIGTAKLYDKQWTAGLGK